MKQTVILFGTSSFSVPIAEALLRSDVVALRAIVTMPDKPAGRKKTITAPVLKEWALKNTISVLQPEKLDAEFLETISAISPRVGVIASYGRIIPESVLDIFPKGLINVHPSLLPRHRGASPIQSTILAGDAATGITLMLTDKEMDHGPIIAQQHFPIWPTETAHELQMRLAQHSAELLTETLPHWLDDTITPTPQVDSMATYAPMLQRDDGRIDWAQPATAIDRRVRAFDPWPGTFTHTPDGKRLKVLFVDITEGPSAKEPGVIAVTAGGELIVRAEDAWVRLIRVQPEGKLEMDGKAFINGHKDIIGQRFQ